MTTHTPKLAAALASVTATVVLMTGIVALSVNAESQAHASTTTTHYVATADKTTVFVTQSA